MADDPPLRGENPTLITRPGMGGIDHNKVFGEEIRFLRERKAWSQEELAWRANRSRNHISRIEQGTSSPTLDTIVSLCSALDTTVEVVLAQMSRRLDLKEQGSGDDDATPQADYPR